MAVDKARVGAVAMEAMDQLDEGGALGIPDAELGAVAVIVAVDHDDQTTINYRFKAADGSDLDRAASVQLLARVLANIMG